VPEAYEAKGDSCALLEIKNSWTNPIAEAAMPP
jgi:hypothetical protein